MSAMHGTNAIHHQRKARLRRVIAQMRSVIEAIVTLEKITGSSGRSGCLGLGEAVVGAASMPANRFAGMSLMECLP